MAGSIKLETKADAIELDDVFRIVTQAPWASKRTRAQVERMLRNSQFVVLASIEGEPVGFARAISDIVFRAFIEDVIVTPKRRGCGIGAQMMNALEEMIRGSGIPRMELSTQHPEFWSKLGFRERQESKYLLKWLND